MVWLYRKQYNLELTLNWKQTAKDQFWTSVLYIDTKAIKPTIASFSVTDLNMMMMLMIL